MYEYEIKENIIKLIEKETGKKVVKFVPRIPDNKEMCAVLENGMILKARSHIEMKRLLEKPKGKGLIE
jgi:hypothetical protein